ncbi:hypothetical protein BO70DRAFT_331792 [Aspergillus heteromorphus CBS 117.55]|uniref:F-box domain-containing protein n=1 Tax=Aspergillus heteromorphus CBS 117.55 TaxID=1448321 RepID=A0A317WPP4_9EURO|nr:uncharacterized protein BO70DRAFT_331792 [Aspergillus heteromorphus CBS 117.55]PWY88399.1 hypothetical protein BO70DRAFT_331792 [Aspergillus heteromorphus CBS 117.55]
MLSKLPPELLAMVLNNMTRTDLKSLCEVSKDIHFLTVPYLYKSLVISTTQPSAQNITSTIKKIDHSHLVHTRDLSLCGPFHGEPVNGGCPFHDHLVIRNEHLGLEVNPFEPFSQFMDDLHLAVSTIPEDQLRTFRWDLGTCLPDEVAQRIDLMLREQSQITSISLIGDSDCRANRNASCSIHLARLSRVQSLSWKGLKRYDDFESVRDFIAAHGPHLKTLYLDLIGWDSARLTWSRGFLQKFTPNTRLPENFFAQSVLGLQGGELRTPLPALQRLSLSQVSLSPMETELVDALNMGALRALQLSNCPGTFRFLRQTVRSGVPLKLESLELTFNPEHLNQITDESQDGISETVGAFLKSFDGLRDIHLMLPVPTDWGIINEGTMHHRSTLKHLITHGLDRTEYGDSMDTDIFHYTINNHLLSPSIDLHFFGVSIKIGYSFDIHEEFDHHVTPNPNIKILHLRSSGPMRRRQTDEDSAEMVAISNDAILEPIAQWAFGPCGYLNLQVLAFGDFSYDGYYNEYNILLCRDGDYYRRMTSADVRYWDLLREYMGALGLVRMMS